MKKIYQLGITMLLLLAATLPAARAYNFVSGGIYYDITGGSPNTVAVTYATGSYNSYSGNVDIPSTVTYNGTTYTVTAIGNNAFRNCSGLTGVSIPGTVTSIGDNVFESCGQLHSVTFPTNLTTIGANAFYYSGLYSVTIPAAVTSIGSNAFRQCSSLRSANFYASNCTSAPSIFYGCSHLDTLTIGSNVHNLPGSVFSNLSALKKVHIPSSVTSMGNNPFAYCPNLDTIVVAAGNSVFSSGNHSSYIVNTCTHTLVTGCKRTVIPNSVTHIGGAAFAGCTGLTGALTIPNQITIIGANAYSGCSGLTSLTIGHGVDSIGNSAFSSCSGISSVAFNADSCRYMGSASSNTVFSGCGSFSTLTIGNNVKTIPAYAFYGCNHLTGMLVIPNSVKYIGASAFTGCNGLTSLSLGNSVTSIGSNAFYICSNMGGTLTIPQSVKTIGSSAFYKCTSFSAIVFNADSCTIGSFSGCSNVTSLTIGNNVKVIPASAFSGLSQISEVLTIPNSVLTIGQSAFSNCSGLTSLTIGNAVSTIGNNAFINCSGLTSLTIGNAVSTIGNNAFSNCGGLSSITFNADSCVYMGSNLAPVFSGCANVTTLNIGDNVRTIPAHAFRDLAGLTGVLNIPNSVENIGSSAFYACSGLTSITNGNEVKSFGYAAFSGCSGLTGSLTIPNSVKSIGDYAFSGCTGIETLTIGRDVQTIGGKAFEDCTGLTHIYFNADSCISMGSATSYSSYLVFSGCTSPVLLNIGDNVKIIPNLAFMELNVQGSVAISNSVISIGSSAFKGCANMDSIIIGKSVTNIGSDVFKECVNLSYVEYNADSCSDIGYNVSLNNGPFLGLSHPATLKIGDNVKVIPGRLFYGFTGLRGTLIIPDSVFSIKSSFQGCTNIDSVIIGESVKTIESSFVNCSGLKHVAFNPDSCVSADYGSFSGCDSLSSLIIGNNVKSIPYGIFSNCTGLSGSIIIPNSVTIIGSRAFYNCNAIDSLIIGKSVTSIMDEAFENCSGLSYVEFNADSCMSIGAYSNGYSNTGTIFDGCTHPSSLVIGDNVKIIPQNAFNGLTGLQGDLIIPDSVVFIGTSAFKNCSGLTSLVIGKSVREIRSGNSYSNSSTFAGCTGITTMSFNADSCTIAGNGSYPAFQGLTNLTSLIIGDNVKILPDNVFRSCKLTGKVVIPDSVIHIGNSAFWWCYNLDTLIMGNSVTFIGKEAFYGCSRLKGTLIIPNTVKTIEDYAFRQTSIDSLIIGRNVSLIDTGAFKACSALKYVEFNADSCIFSKGYSNRPLANCDSIVSLIIGNNVKNIPTYAFYGCSRITGELLIPDSVITIEDHSFSNCSGFTSLSIGRSVDSIGSGAFSLCTGLTSITSYKVNPPSLAINYPHSFDAVSRSAYVHVPCGSEQAYRSAWRFSQSNSSSYFYYYDEDVQPYILALLSDDTLKGIVQIATQPTCTSPAVIEATPNFFYVFDHWSDGNTDNPRTIEVTQDTVLVALFREYALTVASNDTAYGQAVILQEPTAVNPQATIAAVIDPNSTSSFLSNGSLRFVQFTHWSDGNTENPRTITLTSDTSLIAYFNTLDIIIYDTSYGHVEVLQEPTAENPTAIIEAIPSTCTEFYGWESYYLSDTTNPLIINLTQDTIIYAFFVDKFDVEISGEKRICEGDTGVLTASGAMYYLWLSWNSTNGQWDTVCTSDSLFYTESQYYDVIGIDSAGCSSRSGVNVYVQTYHPIVIFSGKTDVCEGESATITASTLGDYGLAEDFSTGIPSDWTVSNNVLQTYNLGGEHGTAIMLPGYSIPNNTIDELILPTMNLHYISSPGLFFDVAYRGPFSGGSTSLKVLLSLDEGATWTVLYSRSGSQLSAYNYYDNEFFPTDNQWLSQNKSLPDSGNAQIKFVFKGGQSNNLWVDNIRVYSLSDPYSYYYQWGDYQWGDGSTERKRTFDSTGVYQVTITNVCSTTDSVTINIWEPSDTTEITVNTPESYYVMNGETFCTSGDYTLNLQNVHGCDSVVILHLTVTPHFTVVNDTVFGRRFVSDNGSRQQIDGRRYSYQYKMTPDNYAQWADSVLTMWTEWYDSTSIALSYDSATSMAAWGYTYVYDYRKESGSVVSQKSIYLDASYIDSVSYEVSDTLTFLSSFGCDSSVIWKTQIYFKDIVELHDLEECNYVWQGDSIYYLDYRYSSDRVVMGFAAGDTLTESGKYRQKLTNVSGCDSTVYWYLTIHPTVYEDITVNACDSYTHNGVTYTESGEYIQNADTLLTIDRKIFSPSGGWCYLDRYGVLISIHPNGWSSLQYDHTEIDDETGGYLYYYKFTDQYGVEHPYIMGDTILYTDTVPGCSVTTLHLTINPSVTELVEATACDFYTWNDSTYTTSGEYVQTFTAANGCDSTVTLQLIINESKHTDTTAESCGSYTWNETTYTSSGEYTQTFTAANGCDSTVTLQLTILPLPTPNITGVTTVCEGQTATLTATGGVSYLWEDGTTTNTYPATVSGLYTVTVTNAEGCSATASATVTVNPLPEVAITGNTAICPGGSTVLTATGADSYQWSNGSTNPSIPVNMFGQYSVIGTSSAGCFSTASVTVLVSQPPVITVSGNTDICAGESTTLTANGGVSYMWSNGSTADTLVATTSGNWQVIGYNADGCSNMASVTVNVWQPASSDLYITAFDSCYMWFGMPRCESGNYTYTLQTIHGCDSVITLHLTLEDAITTEFNATSCDSYTWNGITYSQSGNYTQNFTAANGNDSIVTLHLTINNPVHTATTAESCSSFDWNDQTYTVSGDYTYEHLDANGCTQVDTLHLTIFNPVHTAITAGSCGSYVWNGQTYTVSGDYTYEHLDANGCTQVDTLHLTIFNPVYTAITAESCGSYYWNGQTYTESGDYTYEHLDANGCTQVDTLHLTVNDTKHVEFADSTCTAYTWNGQTYASSGDYTQTFTAANGCDSLVTLHLTIVPTIMPVISVTGSLTACDNGSATLSVPGNYGNFVWSTGALTPTITVSEAGYYWVTATDAYGCEGVSEMVQLGGSTQIDETPAICMVDVEDSHNLLIWEELSDPDVASYRIYRENNQANVFEPLAVIPAGSVNAFADSTADPSVRAWRYKITAADTCGGETPMSGYHKTVHLTINQGLGNSWNLIWTPYEGLEFASYKLYRGTANNNLQLIQTMPATLTSYTDNNPSGDALFYQIEVVMTEGCVQHTRDITHTGARSNIVYNQVPVMAEETVSACESYDWNGQTITSSGDYTQTFVSELGYDSVVTLHLTIHHTPVFSISGNLAISQGQSTALSVPNNAGWSYLWNTGETASVIIVAPSETTSYSVTVTEGTCNASDSVTVTVNTGIDDHDGFDFTVYPNPTTNIVNVQCTMYNVQFSGTEIHIVDMYGKLVRTKPFDGETTLIDISDLANGIYFVKAMADGNVVAVRKVEKR